MDELVQFDKVIKPSIKPDDMKGICCLTNSCKDLNIEDLEEKE